MAHYMTQCMYYLRRLDAHLPVLLFVCLLSWQNTVAVGAANWAIQPELVAADGQLLTTADFCNRGDIDANGNHCVKCTAVSAYSFDVWRTVAVLPYSMPLLFKYSVYEVFRASLYKGFSVLLRGPPRT